MQKKYELHFNFGEEENEKVLNSSEIQNQFIKKYKSLIAKELKIDEKNLIFKDIHRGSLAVSFLQIKSSNDLKNSIYNLKGKYNIEKIEQKPLLETIQISSNILDFDNIDKSNSDRRSNDNWKGYGLKVRGMYDNGNNNWLDDTGKKSEFINAYLGINNFLGDSNKMLSDLKNLTENIEEKFSSNRNDKIIEIKKFPIIVKIKIILIFVEIMIFLIPVVETMIIIILIVIKLFQI